MDSTTNTQVRPQEKRDSLDRDVLEVLRAKVGDAFHKACREKIKMVKLKHTQKSIATHIGVGETALSLYMGEKEIRITFIHKWFEYLWNNCKLFEIDITDIGMVVQEIVEARLEERERIEGRVISQESKTRRHKRKLLTSTVNLACMLEEYEKEVQHNILDEDTVYETALVKQLGDSCRSFLEYVSLCEQ